MKGGNNMILNFIRGFCMALADSVPGVSGGTVAFLLGFYDQFINSLDALMSGSMEEKKNALKFLFKILIGWVIGFVLAVSILASLFTTHIYKISSLFMGFILFAIPVVIKEEKKNMVFSLPNIISGLLGIVLVVFITYFNPISGQGSAIDLTNLNFSLILYVFVAAMIAISAMVLPGISGSTLLLIFGLYVPIISAIKAVLHLEFAYLPILIIFGLGILTGIASIVRIIKWSLENHRSIVIFLIIGMMIGSFYAIIMGPLTLEIPQAPLSLESFSILWFIIGGLVIYGLQKLKDCTEKKNY